MANLTISIEKKETKTETVELPIPCFFRSKCETRYVGLLDEKTVVSITSDKYENTVRNFNNEEWSAGKGEVEFAYSQMHSCTETEFLEKFDKVIESISLHPKLAV